MAAIVIGEFYQRMLIISIPFEINYTIPQHVFKSFDGTLLLYIRLRVENGAKFNLGTKPALE